MSKKFKFRTSQRLKTIVSTALIVPLTAFTFSAECDARNESSLGSPTAFAYHAPDSDYNTVLSSIDETINAEIELNTAIEEKAGLTPELEVAYEKPQIPITSTTTTYITTEPVVETETVTVTETEVVTTEPVTQETTQPESVTEAEKPTEPEDSENTTEPEITNEPDENTSSGYTDDNGLYVNETLNPNWDSSGHLTAYGGVYQGPSGKETYYNLPMSGVVSIMRNQGFDEENYPYWEREDGCKMLGDYIMVAADLSIRPRGSLVETSLGMGLVCDTGEFIHSNQTQLDIAVTW